MYCEYQWLSDGHGQKCLLLCPVTNWNKCYLYSATGQGRKETLLTVFNNNKKKRRKYFFNGAAYVCEK